MLSTTYLINMHGGAFFFITIGLIAAVLVGSLALTVWLTRKLKLSPGVSKAVVLAIFFAGFGGILLGRSFLNAAQDMGGVRKIFVLPTQGESKLAAWCTRIYGKKAGADYEQYIRTFDLMTGRHLGSVRVDPKYPSDDYRLYWTGGNKAWGYRKGPGVMLIDLAAPQTIADNAGIVKQNPVLGGGFIFKNYIDAFDRDRTGLYLQSADGRIYRLHEDLTAEKVTDLPVEINLKPEWAFAKHWDFHPLKTSKGKHAHIRGSRCHQDKSLTLLEPRYIPESNFSVTQKERTWVLHQSALLGEPDWLLSYMQGDGTALNTINVSQLIRGEPLQVIATYTLESEILIFISAGSTFRSRILGFSLAALLTDARTGEYLRTIAYF